MRNFSIIIVLLLSLGSSQFSFATNGMNMIGYGARMSAMGGASLGMSGDTNLMNTNPAGISTINNRRLDAGLGLLMPMVNYKNSLNDVDAESSIFPLPSIGYVHGNTDSRWTFGVGIYAQGGMGATYEDVKHSIFKDYSDYNPLTQGSFVGQQYHSSIAYMKFSPTVAYQATDELSVGVSLNIGYAMMEMNMPYSIDPSLMKGAVPGAGGMTFGQMFGGPMTSGGLGYEEVTAYADLEDGVTGIGYGAKFGARYEISEKISIGAAYTMKTTLDFSGDASMDMSSQFGDAYDRMVMGALSQGMAVDPYNPTAGELQGAQVAVNTQLGGMGINPSLGMAADYDVDIEFSWPRQLGVGGMYEHSDNLRVAVDVSWINWSDSMESFVMKLKGGQNANINAMMGSGSMTMEMPLDWDDQIVIGLGAEYEATDVLTLRGGFNYAKNPIPGETVIPIFPAVVQSHIALGAGYKINDSFSIDGAYEYVPSYAQDAGVSIIANEYDGHTSELGENIVHITGSYHF
ncbi:OmpP1/FadL family transporter [Candidatus Latescibacterota bacterium]